MGNRKTPAIRPLLYGLWAGWTGVLLLARSGVVRFTVKAPPDGILSYCFLNGYPKQQDYFWFGAMVLGGLFGVVSANLLFLRLPKPGSSKKPVAIIALACALSATLMGLSKITGLAPVIWLLYLGGLVAPWFYRGWHSDSRASTSGLPSGKRFPRIGVWVAVCLSVSVVWVADARLRCRMIDGIHEGTQLLYVQSILDGQKLGLDFRTEYGPLGTLGLFGWMKIFGLTIAQERLYFLFMQAIGVAAGLAVFRLAGLGWLATGAGSLVVLAESSALGVQYGGATAMRPALAFLAVILFWRGRTGGLRWLACSGAAQAFSLVYSPDFGMASALAITVMAGMDWFLRGKRGVLSDYGKWAGAFLACFAMLALAVYGMSAPRGLSGVLFGGYGGARLAGHGALPFPEFELSGDWKAFREIWLIGLVSTGMIAWSFISGAPVNRRLLAAGAGIFTLFAMVPGLARPMGQYLFAVPPFAFLVAAGLDGCKGKSPLYLGGIISIICLMDLVAVTKPLIQKYTPCDSRQGAQLPERLGGVEPVAMMPGDVLLAARTIAGLSRKGDHVYLGAPRHAHLCFLADRSGLPPYPSGAIAVTSRQRAEALESLKKYRPPVALLSPGGIDIPYAVEHREEVDYIKRNYRLALKTGELEIYSLK